MREIKNIAIVGGTHGNEFTGVYLIQKLKYELPELVGRYGLNIEPVLANPRACEQRVRFIDYDLNRSFFQKDLADITLSGYEFNRAKVINQLLGPKGASRTDLIIDVHSSTSHMGITIILVSDNAYHFELASYIASKLDDVYIYYIPPGSYSRNSENEFLASVSPLGFSIEMGPIPNNVARHDLLEKAETVIRHSLEFISSANKGKKPGLPGEIEVYEHRKSVDFPTDGSGRICAVIHKELQGRDYQPLKKGDPVFFMLSGEVVRFEEDETYFPIFINEAAYYYKNTAFTLTSKKTYRYG